ncbi:MAG: right-handed parallel beta-helix repeat-containing protein, partial [Promethearchaeota archaeon]
MYKFDKLYVPIIFSILVISLVPNPISGVLPNIGIIINDDLQEEDTILHREPKSSQIQIKNETINTDETWSGNILVTRSITVSKDVTLTILPGTVVKFKHYRGYKNPDARLSVFVLGTIKALGSPDQQIWFTSDAEPPINGDWDGIYMNGTTDSVFNYTIIEYGLVGIVQFHSESLVVNSIVRWVNTEGLYAEYSNVVYANNTLYGNGYHEIALEQFNNVTIVNNIFKNGIVAFHSENSEAYLKGNYFVNYSGDIVSVAAHSNVTLEENIFDPSLPTPQVTVTPNANVTLINNDN